MRLRNILITQYRNMHKSRGSFSDQSRTLDDSMGWLGEIKNRFLLITLVLCHLRIRSE